MAMPQSAQSILRTWVVIRKPTITSAGATASNGTILDSGAKNAVMMKSAPVTTLAIPVRAPSPTPAADSTKISFADTEAKPPTADAAASTSNTGLASTKLLSLSRRFASLANPVIVPMASKKTLSRIVNVSSDAEMTPI